MCIRAFAFVAVALFVSGCSGTNTVPNTAPRAPAVVRSGGQSVTLLSGEKGQAVSVAPATLMFNSPTAASKPFTATENFAGEQTAVVSSPDCASVSPTSGAATVDPTIGGTKSLTYTVTPVASGNCIITVTDKKGNTATVAVAVLPAVIGECSLPTANAGPEGAIKGPDGNIWISENIGNIARVTPNCAVTEFPVPGAVAAPYSFCDLCSMTVGPDGNIWFDSIGGDFVGRITMTGVVTEFPGNPNCTTDGITTGPDGNLWFNGECNALGRVTTSGVLTMFSQRDRVNQCGGIVTGADHNLWSTGCGGTGVNNQISRYNPIAGTFTFFPLPDQMASHGFTIINGPDGNLWWPSDRYLIKTPSAQNKIYRITLTGTITGFSIPSPDSHPFDLIQTSEGSLWFTEGATPAKVATITTTGAITEYSLPNPNSGLFNLAQGGDGNLWIPLSTENKIAVFKFK